MQSKLSFVLWLILGLLGGLVVCWGDFASCEGCPGVVRECGLELGVFLGLEKLMLQLFVSFNQWLEAKEFGVIIIVI